MIRIEADAIQSAEHEMLSAPIRLITNQSKIRVTLKRRVRKTYTPKCLEQAAELHQKWFMLWQLLEGNKRRVWCLYVRLFLMQIKDCNVVASKLILILDDLLWVLTDSQLKAMVQYAKSLSEAMEKSAQQRKSMATDDQVCIFPTYEVNLLACFKQIDTTWTGFLQYFLCELICWYYLCASLLILLSDLIV